MFICECTNPGCGGIHQRDAVRLESRELGRCDTTNPFPRRPLPVPENPVIGCEVDRPIRLRQISDDDLVRVANENYDAGRKHGKEETLDERETLIYWLLRAYHSGHRQGWESGPNTDETMNGILDVLANRGYDPNEDQAAKELIARLEKR